MNKPTTRKLPTCETPSTDISFSAYKENKIVDPQLRGIRQEKPVPKARRKKMKGFYSVTERTLWPTKTYVKFSYYFAACTPSEIGWMFSKYEYVHWNG